MPGDKKGLIAALHECALLLELSGGNPFRSRALEQGARVLEGLEGEPADWIAQDKLKQIKGIGKGLIEKIEEWSGSEGRLSLLEELRRKVPSGVIEMRNIPGLGPKKIKQIWEERGIDSLEKLEAAAKSGILADLPGFGQRTAERILAGIQQRKQYAQRHRIDIAAEVAETIIGRLRPLPAVGRLEVGGSLRRALETVKDLDFVATSESPRQVIKFFEETPGVESIVASGDTKCSILLGGGIPVDLRVVAPDQFAAALNYFTGSKLHNTHLRARAKRMGFKLNEYGLFRDEDESGEALPIPDETALYEHLGLSWIPPELREDMGEIEAAENRELPELLTQAQMQGVIHCHTHSSDGKNTVLELAQACQNAGYKYLTINDHSQSAAYANGLKPETLEHQIEEIERVNRLLKGFRVFSGVESDINADGSLDYSDELLDKLDVVIVAIHNRMGMPREEMTERICRAVEHPAAAILAHPSGRLLLQREPYEIDEDQIFKTCARCGVAIEINAHPSRLDLDWRSIRRARAAGCRFSIDPDAHDMDGIKVIRYGVGVARKGWLGPKDVINTMSAGAFANWLTERRKSRVAGITR